MKISMIFNVLIAFGLVILIGIYAQRWAYTAHHVAHESIKSDADAIFNQNIVELALQNTSFRKVLVTGSHSQVVLMSIPVGGDIGLERHDVDQTLVFVQGYGRVVTNDKISEIYPQSLVFIPAGVEHNFINSGSDDLKLFTVYAPSQHKPGTVQEIKSE